MVLIQTSMMQLSLMDEGGNTKDDLGLPKGTDDADKLAEQIKKDFDDGKELVVTVLKVKSRGSGAFCSFMHCTAVCIVLYILYCMHCIVGIVLYALHSTHCTVCMQCIVSAVQMQRTVCIVCQAVLHYALLVLTFRTGWLS